MLPGGGGVYHKENQTKSNHGNVKDSLEISIVNLKK